ncbi:outer membrane protein assembly factor BamB family protein [Bythopirellula polymerisocia]|nr:PQQ-binding-like beta-propeller repeat protein [Bythopirellula polymerisocia]
MNTFGLVCSVCLAACQAESPWPQFRGPNGQGISTETNLPLKWDETTGILWKTPISGGTGCSSPVVAEGKVWLTSATEIEASPQQRKAKLAGTMLADQKLVARAITLWLIEIDLATGNVDRKVKLIEVEDPQPIHSLNSYASPTPVWENGRIYCHFGDYGTVCYDSRADSILWKTRLPLDHRVGPGSSPILYENLLILTCDGADQQYISAIDKDTGYAVWRQDRPSIRQTNGEFRKSYSTPLVIEVAGNDQMIIPGAQWCIAYEPLTGKEIWRVDHGEGFSLVPRPVFDGDYVFICTGYPKAHLLAIRPDGSGDVTKSHLGWEHSKQIPTIPSPLVVEGCVFTVNDAGIAICVDAATGVEHWRKRFPGKYASSPLYCEGRIYACNQNGLTTVFAAGDEFDLLAENQIKGSLMASPVPVDSTLLLRSVSHLYRIGKQR